MRILNFEDDVYKANDIKKALDDRCGVTDVTQVDNVEEGLELLIQEKEAGNPFDFNYYRYALSDEKRRRGRFRCRRKTAWNFKRKRNRYESNYLFVFKY